MYSGLPSKLYRYQSLDRSYVLQSLESDTLFFSSPSSFNDPYDCRFIPEFEESSEEELKKIKASMSDNPNLDPLDQLEFLGIPDCEMADLRVRAIVGVRQSAATAISNIGVCCFTERNDNLLMWSHYGACGTGVCLEFDGDVFGSGINKVIYREQLPRFNLFKMFSGAGSAEDIVIPLLCTKSVDWQYEEEWRVLSPEKGKLYSYRPEKLTGVYFGPESNQECIKKVLAVLKKRGFPVQAWKGSLSKSFFRVEFKQVDY